MKLSVSLFLLISMLTTSMAEMPDTLKGSWILNADATSLYIKTSPKWDASGEKYLPTILKRMSQMAYVFNDKAIVVSMRGREQALPVTLSSSEDKTYVFDGELRGKSVTMTVSFIDETTINIRSSATDDMDYYLWSRGEVPGEDGPSDEELATEVMKKAME